MTNWKRSVLIFFNLIIFSGFDSNLAFFVVVRFLLFLFTGCTVPSSRHAHRPNTPLDPLPPYPSYCASSISSLHVQLILQYHVVLLSSVF